MLAISTRWNAPGWAADGAAEGAAVVSYYGYDDCIRLENDHVRVVLCPAAGGRVLEYSLDGENVLYLPPGDEGWTDSGNATRGRMNAGRFDIGPEKVVRRGNVLWSGRWTGEVTGNRSARLTSQYDPTSGARLIRDFQLHDTTSQLRCTQTIVNESVAPVSLCHWSRTFAVGNGVAVVPRSPRGRFPNGYVMYDRQGAIQMSPQDPNIRVSDEAVIVSSAPEFPKLGFDSHAGWLAYLAPNDQLFVKRFETYPERAYNELAALTISVWYPDGEMVELEPIGPAENLSPGQHASFSEEWWLLPHKFPSNPHQVDYEPLRDRVMRETLRPGQPPSSVVSPQIHADRSVTFRLVGSSASTVTVSVANRSRELALDVDGVWKHHTEPLDPGIHEYTFEIDGVRVTDPRNRWVKKWNVCASLFEIPGEPPLVTAAQEVPHGTTHRHIYRSGTTGNQRSAVVYTPPGYDRNSEKPYPVVVLCHGFGDDETAWTEVGRAHLIADNLIASARIKPMVIVMPNGHPVPLAERTWSEDYGSRNTDAMTGDIVNDLLPLVEQHYHVASDAAQRAIVGLSMGGGHSISIGLSHSGSFDWVGAFSAATPQHEAARELLDRVGPEKNDQSQTQRKLFWIACGTDDFLIERNRAFNELLNQRGIEHTYVETQGAHNWGVWRDYLPTFLEKLFRTEDG